MAESRKIEQLILLPLCFQILIAVSIAANEYPFDEEYAETLTNMLDVAKAPQLTFDGTHGIGNAEQPHTLKVSKAHWNGVGTYSITFNVIEENKFYVEPLINGDIKGRFRLETISLDFRKTLAEVAVRFRKEGNEDELSFYGRLFTKSDDDSDNIGRYAIVQDPITTSQIESLMKTRNAEGTMEWVKALIKDPPSTPWYNTFLHTAAFCTKPMLMTKQVSSRVLELIRNEHYRSKELKYGFFRFKWLTL